MSMTPSIDWRSCISRPGSVHRVRCFEISCSHPHWGHLLLTPFSHSDSLELQPHHPDTCFVTNVRNVFGYPAIAFSYPSHHTESKCTARTIFFSLKNFFAVDLPKILPVPPLVSRLSSCHPFLSKLPHLERCSL